VITTALAERNRRVRAALRRIARERDDRLAIACLEQAPRREEPAIDERPLAATWPSEFRDWAPGELVEAFGK
jgi:hypothetical protein